MQHKFALPQADRFRQARISLGWTLAELGKETSYAFSTIAKLEKTGLGSARLVDAIIAALRLNPEWIKTGVLPMVLEAPEHPRPGSLAQLGLQLKDLEKRMVEDVSRIRDEIVKRSDVAGLPIREELERVALTNVHTYGHSRVVRWDLPKLIEELRHATQGRGGQARVSRELKVNRRTISAWLSGESEPGGDAALRLLYWVLDGGGKRNGPGSAEPPPEPKAQSTKELNHENQGRSGPRKH
jgi:transcriptional regulator with XRE-family HTH domain